jgi:amino acid adenylation domain-containing protein
LLLAEVFTHYRAATEGRPAALGPVRPYRDFVLWLRGRDRNAAEAFWRRALAGTSEPTPIDLGAPAALGQAEVSRDHALRLSVASTAALRGLARDRQVTLSTVVEGAWGLLLSRYSGHTEPVFGVTVAGRPAELAGVESMLGLFINTVPLPTPVREAETVSHWLQQLQQWQAELRQYEHTPLTEIRGCSPLAAGQPLFETIVVFENYPVDQSLRDLGAGFAFGDVRFTSRTNYPLSLVVAPGPELALQLGYDSRRWEPSAAERVLQHLGVVLENFTLRPEGPLADCRLLTAAERQALLLEGNDTAAVWPGDAPVHELFQEQAACHPERTAVVCEGKRMTYGELAERSGRLAARLRILGAGPEAVVGLYFERSLDMMVALLAILDAGAAWLPLDPDQPAERLAAMLADSGASLVISEPRLAELAGGAKRVLVGDRGPARRLPARFRTHPEALAYVIYTSGSTGRPKGVMNTHGGLRNRLLWMQEAYGLTAADRVLQKTPISFDVSVWELLWPLMVGARLVLARPGGHQEPDYLSRVIADEGITTLHFVPSMLRVFLDAVPTDALAGRPLRIVASGETLTVDLRQRCLGIPGVELHNLYGPTEAAIDVTVWTCRQDDSPRSVPIGRPIANTEIHLLDRGLRPVPTGALGELCIGGAGLARGYVERPDLTAERFVPDAWSGRRGARLYRSGDLARRLRSGELEYLGRLDRQVKIRGVRIEPAEIEEALARHPGIAQAAVAAQSGGGETRLVAWIVPRLGAALPASISLSAFLRERLPEPMVPSAWVVMDDLPRTASGKVDRRALPAPDRPAPGSAAPRDPLEQLLAEIWAGILDAERVGLQDNWFELGGHSLHAMRLMTRVRRVFGVDLPLRDVFEAPTVAALAVRIDAARRAGWRAPDPIAPRARSGPQPLSYAQQSLWLHDQLEPGDPSYNSPAVLRLRGRLDVGALAAALREVVRRHEVLRARFSALSGQPVQFVADVDAVPPAVVDLAGLPAVRREGEARELVASESLRAFDLQRGPLLRTLLLRFAATEHLGILVVHHIATDAWSAGILVRELSGLYDAALGGRPSPLPRLPVQYTDYAAWQRQRLQGEVLAQHLAYWRVRLANAPVPECLPIDYPRRRAVARSGAACTFLLPAELGDGVRRLSRGASVTPFMVLLTAWSALLGRWTGQTDVVIGTVVAGRGRLETENLIGFFINMLPIRIDLSGSPRAMDLLSRVRDATLEAYDHQELPFDKLVEELRPKRESGRTPLFEMTFSLDNLPREEPSLSGLAVELVEMRSPTARLDFTVWVRDRPDGFAIDWTYRPDLFRPATIERLASQLETLVREIVERPEGRLLVTAGTFSRLDGEHGRAEQLRRRESDAQNLHHVRRRRLVPRTASPTAGDQADEEIQHGK